MDDVEQVLAAKRTEIEAELAALAAPVEDTGGISFGKRVGDGTSIAVERITQVAAHDGLQEVLTDVVRAEAKLADGSYGVCEICGDPIPQGRLEARPWSVRCVKCS
ncbi:MAG TPA: TraR/DksA C4-type zinc finger protein [Actinomycetes bacterium]|nr:TraR/DksA C4-type zinc finger protein [Actinomycetes bacterium]